MDRKVVWEQQQRQQWQRQQQRQQQQRQQQRQQRQWQRRHRARRCERTQPNIPCPGEPPEGASSPLTFPLGRRVAEEW